jgi:hypothetical protein
MTWPLRTPQENAGVPLTSISWSGGMSLRADLTLTPREPRTLVFGVHTTPDGIVGLGRPPALAAQIGRAEHELLPLYEALLAFWRAGGTRAGSKPLQPVRVWTPLEGPRLHRIDLVGPTSYELTFLADTSPLQVTVDPDGRVTAADPEIFLIGNPGPIVTLVTTLHRARVYSRDDFGAVLPQARSISEAAAFIELALPLRQYIGWRREVRVVYVRDRRRLRFAGVYEGRHRTIDVDVPDDEQGALEHYLSHGNGRSWLVDAGQWLYLETSFATAAQDHIALIGDDWPNDEECIAVYQELRLALAACGELAKFLPDGADVVPEHVLWTRESRDALQASPESFRRQRIEAALVSHRNDLDDFSEKYREPR